ncbi:SDR family oxidoreductase [Streptomyces sp. IBSBF 2953]|nr:SDR family oxidoreductase [Streptomyces hayashii]
MADSELIAVIGMSGRFPGAADPLALWANLTSGKVSTARLTEDQIRRSGVPADDPKSASYVPVVASAAQLDMFDPGFFDMTRREAEICDPQFRLFLECCHDALLNAALSPAASWDVGVFGAAGNDHYTDLLPPRSGSRWRSTGGMSVGTWNNVDYLSALVSYKLGLRGPSITTQTACSSSLVAVHQAAQALLSGDCEVALAGGVDVELPLDSGYWWDEGGPLSRDGSCRPFDADATGTVFGSGGGAVVLKRLDDALAHGDPIRAVIRGSAVNNDGAAKVGFTAPSVLGQAAVISEAMIRAGVSPSDVRMVEAHATGTALGDPIEVAGLVKAFNALGPAGSAACALGSVKGNIGHLGHAAGIASLIKAVLSLENGTIPASGSFTSLNPKLGLDGSPFYVAGEHEVTRSLTVAGISSFGMGGTNAHVVLEKAPERTAPQAPEHPAVLLWSAKSARAREEYRHRLGARATGLHAHPPAQVAAALRAVNDEPYEWRAAVLADPTAGALDRLLADDSPAVVRGHADDRSGLVFLFPATSGHYTGWQDLTAVHPAFSSAFAECRRRFEDHGIDLDRCLEQAREGSSAHGADELPLVFSAACATAALWQACGIEPDTVLGHGVGEVAAGVVSGVFGLATGAAVVAAMTRALASCPEVSSLLVAASADDITPLLVEYGLSLSAVDSPRQLTVTGAPDGIGALREELRGRGVRFREPVSASAWGSADAASVPAAVTAALAGQPLTRPSLSFRSGSLGGEAAQESVAQPEYWSQLAVRPVLFGQAVASALADDALLLETGAGRTLTTLVRQHPEGKDRTVASLPGEGGPQPDARTSLLQAAAVLWTRGHSVRWDAFSPDGDTVRAPLPGYPYERTLCWPKPTTATQRPASTTPPPAEVPVSAAALTLPHWAVATTSALAPFTADAEATAGRVTMLVLPQGTDAGLFAGTSSGDDAIVVHVTNRHHPLRDGSCEVRQKHLSDDLRRLHTDLQEQGQRVHRLVHALTFTSTEGDLDAQLEQGYRSVVAFVRSFAEHEAARSPELVVLTSRGADVSGLETVAPGRAALVPLVRTLVAEGAVTGACLLDAPVGTPPSRLTRHSRVVPREATVAALRGEVRWTPVESALQVSDALPADTWRAGGTYLITGGYGALAGAVAEQIALLDPQATLVLLSRRERPLTETHLAAQEHGARLVGMVCDITDREALAATVTTVRRDLGEIRAVLHLAGTAGSGVAVLTDTARTAATIGAKVAGTANLIEVMRDLPTPEAFVAFSSRSALDGQPGGADYAVANAVMDALVSAGTPARRSLTINWPAWRDIGMAVPHLRAEQDRQEHSRRPEHLVTVRLEATPGSILDEHRIDSVPVMPGTGTLDLVMRTVLEHTTADGPLELRDVVFSTPLTVAETHAVAVELHDGGSGGWTFRVTSADDPADVYARGSAIVSEQPRPQLVSVPELRARLTTEVPAQDGLGSGMVSFGPHWQAVTGMWTADGTAQKLLALQVPDAYLERSGDFMLHPVLLDCATAAARDPQDALHLPFHYRSITRYAPIPDRAYAWIRRTGAAEGSLWADVDILAADGNCVVRVEGFTMRRVDRTTVRTANAGPGADALVPRPARGIPTEQAAGLVHTILTCDARGRIAIPQYVDGRPARASGPVPALQPGEAVGSVAEPTSTLGAATTVERLQALWAELLGEDSLTPDADFFDLGGNSLTAVELTGRIQEEFAVDLDLGAVFDCPTLTELAEAIVAARES